MRPKVAAEFVGDAILLYAIVGSGIVVQGLSDDQALQLFTHAVIVGLALAVAIALLAPVSGAHLNPAVTVALWRQRAVSSGEAVLFVTAQTLGAMGGVAMAHASFALPLVSVSGIDRGGATKALSEVLATFVLVLLVIGLLRSGRSRDVPWAVGAWVAASIFATPSTGFANPAVTVARSLTATYAGIDPIGVPLFVVAQFGGGLLALVAAAVLFPIGTTQSTREETLL